MTFMPKFVWTVDRYGEDDMHVSCIFGDEDRVARVWLDTDSMNKFRWEIHMDGFNMTESKPLFDLQSALLDVTNVVIHNREMFYNDEPVSIGDL